jgi:hypothetical protein
MILISLTAYYHTLEHVIAKLDDLMPCVGGMIRLYSCCSASDAGKLTECTKLTEQTNAKRVSMRYEK